MPSSPGPTTGQTNGPTTGPIAGLILAGGLARRMGGGDKTLRLVAGRTVLDRILDRLRRQADPVLLNANGDPARFAGYGLTILPDPLPGHAGPLAGVLAGLEWAQREGQELLLTVPGDSPFLPADLVERLQAARQAAGVAIACASSGGQSHPVVAIWPAALAGTLRQALRHGAFKVDAFAADHGRALVEWPISPVDPFTNVNCPDDIDQATADARRLPEGPLLL